MERYQLIIEALEKKFTQGKFDQLLTEIGTRGGVIVHKQNAHQLPQISLTNYLRKSILATFNHTKSLWFVYFNRILDTVYKEKSQAKPIIYRALPALTIKLIQIYASEIQGLDQCLLTIYSNEYQEYNESLLQKSQPSKNEALGQLYQTHMLRKMTDFSYENLQKIQKITTTSKNAIKNLVFYLIYKNAGQYGQQSLMDFYHSIFIYCGVEEKEVLSSKTSLYLLQKTNKISVFRFSITESEVSWIILTLYELFTQINQDKFDLLATINILHKKVSNECQFKMSEVAQSLIQLLEDEYSSVFS